MSAHLLIFVTLILITLGIAIVSYQVWSTAKRRKMLKIYALIGDDQEKQTDTDSHLVQALEKLTSSFSSQEGEIKEKLEEAGLHNQNFAKYYMHFKYGVSVLGIVLIYLLANMYSIASSKMVAAMAVWFVTCIIFPDSLLAARKRARQQRISGQLPYLLDLMAICVQTGMTLEATIKYLSLELRAFDKELASLLAKLDDRAQIVSLERALDELYEKLPTSEIRSFVMTLKQSLQYGSSIYQVLTTLASDIRDVNMLAAEERIGKLAAKMSLPLIVFIMMPIVVIILAPAVMRFMDHV
ncbi:type II secretion system F family protein [Vibrio sp. VPAP30]|uniref:type II secretion system F family protein n=1 Tax=Vibrio sp. VPAP30 TaxID=1647102 RepID=UPI000659869B|nr:type II secretion system F family protein [Vibrio sp. VPAP30]KLN63255.1 biotin synthase [Vibrio sp. VPAP30]